VNSRATRSFWSAFRGLPADVRDRAREAYADFTRDPAHPSLRFKRVHSARPIYSVRVTRGYRAIGLLRGDTVIWMWIGGHQDYERLLHTL
jgi:hypothetical protein